VDKYLKQQDLHLTVEAKALIKPSIQEIVSSRNSRGISTIKNFAESIAFSLLSSSNIRNHEISSEMISDFNCSYVKRLQKFGGRTSIGFNTSKDK
jgi:hypothetical protein